MDIYHFKKPPLNRPKATLEYSLSLKNQSIPLVIDNGSYHCRYGWANSPSPLLDFKNVIAKNRGNRKEKDWDLQIADEITDIDAVRWLLRTPYDFNVVVNYSVQETIFDYAFKQLGINSDGCLSHPIVLTEPVANPTYCRKNMSELLFEAYNVPKVAYGIDCLFCQYYNMGQNMPDASLIISSGFQSTHILPVVSGQADVKNALRINLGGYNCVAYMQRLLQLKHTQYSPKLVLSKMEKLVHELCYIPVDYNLALKNWKTSDNLHSTTLLFDERKDIKTGTNDWNTTLNLEKQLRRGEHKASEIECILQLESDNPEAALKLSRDCGFSGLQEAKENLKTIDLNNQQISMELDQLNCATSFVKLGVEKVQAPEILFQPSLVGFDQCGIKDSIDVVLKRFPADIQNIMAQNVFLTGGTTKINGFKSRVLTDLQELRPYKSDINVIHAENCILDGWKGAAQWALSDHKSWITKQEFEEHGWDYLKTHSFSN